MSPTELKKNPPDYWVEGIQEAALGVAARWGTFDNAAGPVDSAVALVELSNAIFELTTWLPGFDPERGEIDWDLFGEEGWAS